MPNDFYNSSGVPSPGGEGSSAAMRAEFNAIQSGFDKLPDMAGSAGSLVVVNAAADGLQSVTPDTAPTARQSIGAASIEELAGLVVQYLALIGGSMTGPIAMGGNAITNLGSSSAGSSAARMDQVTAAQATAIAAGAAAAVTARDQAIAVANQKLALTGGIMTGMLTMNGAQFNAGNQKIINMIEPTELRDAANKYYVDDSFVNRRSPNVSGNVQMNGNAILNLGYPSNDTDGTTKSYVDNAANAKSGKGAQIVHGSGIAEFGPFYFGGAAGTNLVDLPSPWVMTGLRVIDTQQFMLRGTWLVTT